jgi:hypothetical protein
MSIQNAASWNHSCTRALYVPSSGTRWPTPTTKTTPFVGGPSPAASYSPRTSSRTFARALPSPRRTAEENSLTAHVSPAATS